MSTCIYLELALFLASMDDLAESVIKQLSVDDGQGPLVAVCSPDKHFQTADSTAHALVVPVTHKGRLSWNVEVGSVWRQRSRDSHWQHDLSFNFQDACDVAAWLLRWSRGHDSMHVLLRLGHWSGLPVDGAARRGAAAGHIADDNLMMLRDQDRTAHDGADSIVEALELLGRMRPAVRD
jgi:hypothetical protein